MIPACTDGDEADESVGEITQDATAAATTLFPQTGQVEATVSPITTLTTLGDEQHEADNCVSELWNEISHEPAMIRQFADYEALRAEGVAVDAFGEDFGPELRGVVVPSAIRKQFAFGEPVSIPVAAMACYLGEPFGTEFVRLMSTEPVTSLPETASQESDLVTFASDEPSSRNPIEVDVFGELLARGAIAGTSSAPPSPEVWVTGIGVAPAESGFVLVVLWVPSQGPIADAAALMNNTIGDLDRDGGLDVLAAEVVQDDDLIVATIPVVNRELGIWRELTAIFDPLVFPRPDE